jgi:hypothetical protein
MHKEVAIGFQLSATGNQRPAASGTHIRFGVSGLPAPVSRRWTVGTGEPHAHL